MADRIPTTEEVRGGYARSAATQEEFDWRCEVFDAWREAQDKLTTDRIDGSWQDAIFKLGDAMAGTQAWDAYDAVRRRGYMEALADLTRHMEAARG